MNRFFTGLVEDLDSIRGKIFNMLIIFLIIMSTLLFVLETLPWFSAYMQYAMKFENIAIAIFTFEYLLRWITSKDKLRYPFHFMAIIDLVAIMPFYLGLFSGGSHDITFLRILRLFRIFRIFKIARYSEAMDKLIRVFKENASALGVFVFIIAIILLLSASFMFVIEGNNPDIPPENRYFHTMADSLWWSIVTLTTVGYGDKYPYTALGKMVAGILMIFGIGIIALPTGILGASLTKYLIQDTDETVCHECGNKNHLKESLFCQQCGHSLHKN